MKKAFWMGLLAVFALTNVLWAGTVSVTNSTSGNFDASAGTRMVTITGLEPGFDTGTILDVDISINFAKADGEAFDPPYPGGTPFYNEIHFHLLGPGGAPTVHLIEPGSWGAGSGQFDGTITFDDEAAMVVNVAAAPMAGTFRPTGPGALSDYDAASALGTWTLFIEDTTGADSLRFRSYTLTVQTEDVAPIPEPSTLTLFGLGALGLLGYGWRRRQRAA